jgi:hypothetical protein
MTMMRHRRIGMMMMILSKEKNSGTYVCKILLFTKQLRKMTGSQTLYHGQRLFRNE